MPRAKPAKGVHAGRGANRDHDIHWWGSVSSVVSLGISILGVGISIVGLGLAGRGFLSGLIIPSRSLPELAGVPRLQAVVFIGLAVAAAHGLLWTRAEKLFGWHFGAGGGASLPWGWQAVLLSTTMTLPLVVLPPLYDRLAGTTIVLPAHWAAGGCVVVLSALGHVLIFGVKAFHFVGKTFHFKGVKRILSPLNRVDPLRAWLMEFFFALVHFSSIVLAYRFVAGGPMAGNAIHPALVSGALWLSGVSISIFVTYPESLKNRKGIEIRGMIHAIMLTITLTGGMLM